MRRRQFPFIILILGITSVVFVFCGCEPLKDAVEFTPQPLATLPPDDYTEEPYYLDESLFRYSIQNDIAIVTGYSGEAPDVMIPPTLGRYPVGSIGNRAFAENDDIISVILPESVTVISTKAFQNCTALREINFPSGLKSIGAETFSGCTALSGDVILVGIQSIGDGAFLNCSISSLILEGDECSIGERAFSSSALTDVKLSGLKKLQPLVFENCKKLKSIEFGSTKTIPSGILSGCISLEKAIIAEGVTAIESRAFYSCNLLSEVTLPQSLTYIARDAFLGTAWFASTTASCTQPNDYVVVGDGILLYWNVEYIFDGYVFSSTLDSATLTPSSPPADIILPDNIKHISNIFRNANIRSIELSSNITELGSHAFEFCTSLESIDLKNVERIYGEAFAYCTMLEELNLPESLEYFDPLALYSSWSGEQSFTHITVDENNPVYSSVDGILFNKDMSELINATYASGSYTVPQSVERIGDHAFSRSKIEFIDLSNVKHIGNRAFYECTLLTELDFGDSLVSIGPSAFSLCIALQSAILPEGTESIGDYAFYQSSVSEIFLPQSLKTIGQAAYGDTGITEVTIPSTIEHIGNFAFSDCSSLKTIIIEDGLSEIVDDMFAGCYYIESVYLPDSVTSIADSAFYSTSTMYVGVTTVFYCSADSCAVDYAKRHGFECEIAS